MKVLVITEMVVAVGDWDSSCEKCNNVDTLSERGILTQGPARRIAESPLLIVIGWHL